MGSGKKMLSALSGVARLRLIVAVFCATWSQPGWNGKKQRNPPSEVKIHGAEGHSRRRKASAGSLRLWFLQPFLCFCGLHALSPHESHFWITSLWDRFLLFVTKTDLTTIAPYNRSESDEADNQILMGKWRGLISSTETRIAKDGERGTEKFLKCIR